VSDPEPQAEGKIQPSRSKRLEFRSRVIADIRLSAYARLLYVILDDQFAGEKGCAWPKQPTLAAYAGFSRRQVQRSLYELVEAEYLDVEKGLGGCRYSMSWIAPNRRNPDTPIAPNRRNDCTVGAQSNDGIYLMKQRIETAKTELTPATLWKSSPDFAAFVARYCELAQHFIDEDFTDAFMLWNLLSLPERLERTRSLNTHAEKFAENPRYIPRPRKFLEEWWKRPAVPSDRNSKNISHDELAKSIGAFRRTR
jgi:hypothetical protein